MMKAAVMGEVGQHFRPEFINRLDESVVFHSLNKEQIGGIAKIQLQGLQRRLAERELELNVMPALLEKLVDTGFDPVYGARPLKRAIQKELENPLAQRILAGGFEPGQIITADYQGGEATFTTTVKPG
jgi:ATP-dependent Clp protease ATP-binding subunit ClpB